MTDPNEALAITRVEFAGKRRELPSDDQRALRLEVHQLRMQISALALSRLSAQARADHLERMLAAENDRLERNDFLERNNQILREQAGALRRELLTARQQLKEVVEKKTVYELVDATDDEAYFTAGLFSSVEAAVKFVEDSDPDGLSEMGDSHDSYIKAELRERPLDKWSGTGKVVRVWEWIHEYSENEDEYFWSLHSEGT